MPNKFTEIFKLQYIGRRVKWTSSIHSLTSPVTTSHLTIPILKIRSAKIQSLSTSLLACLLASLEIWSITQKLTRILIPITYTEATKYIKRVYINYKVGPKIPRREKPSRKRRRNLNPHSCLQVRSFFEIFVTTIRPFFLLNIVLFLYFFLAVS